MNDGVPTADGMYSDIPDIVYHADRDSLSSSGARQLLTAPEKFTWYQDNPENTRAFNLGHYVHGLVLGAGAEVVEIPYDGYQSKAAKELRDQAYADGKVPVLACEVKQGKAMAEAIMRHRSAAALLSHPEGLSEVSLYWHDAATGVRCRARIDRLTPIVGRLAAVDVKTSDLPVGPDDWGFVATKYKLYFQAAWYLEALRALEIDDNAAFVFVNVEKKPPYLVSTTQLPQSAIDLGRSQMRRAIEIYAECRAADSWPGYGDEVHVVDIAKYAYYQGEHA